MRKDEEDQSRVAPPVDCVDRLDLPQTGNGAELPLTDAERRIGELVRQAVGDGPFRPHAAHIPGLHQTIVMLRDCSYTEMRRDSHGVALLIGNYGEHTGQVVGLMIDGYLDFVSEGGIGEL